MSDRIEGDRLTPRQHEEIRQEISRDFLGLSEPRDRPRAVIIVGQPGAGKAEPARAAQHELAAGGGSVLIDPDRVRDLHPDYETYLSQNDKTAAARVHADASQWARELRQDAIAGRRNIVLGATFNDKDKARELREKLRAAGYDIDMRALAVHRRDSRQGIQARYENARVGGGEARWVPESIHDEAYKGLPVTIGHIERNGLADRVSVLRRDGTVLYRNDRAATATSGLSQIALLAERGRDPTLEERLRHARSWDKIQAQMRNRNADDRDLAEVSGLRAEAHDRLAAHRAPAVSAVRAEPVPRPGADSVQALALAQKTRLAAWSRRSR